MPEYVIVAKVYDIVEIRVDADDEGDAAELGK